VCFRVVKGDPIKKGKRKQKQRERDKARARTRAREQQNKREREGGGERERERERERHRETERETEEKGERDIGLEEGGVGWSRVTREGTTRTLRIRLLLKFPVRTWPRHFVVAESLFSYNSI